MNNEKYSFLQISCIAMLSVGLLNHVLAIPVILDVSGRDSWIAVIVSTILFIPVFIMIGYMMRKTDQQQIFDWLKSHYGKFISMFFMIIFSIILFSSSALALLDMTNWTTTSYLPNTPKTVVSLVFIALIYYAVSGGFRTIAFASSILLPFVILLGEFVMISNIPYKDYSLLLPILEHGSKPVWNGIMYSSSGFIELILFILVQHQLRKTVKKRHMLYIGLIVSGLTLGPLMGAIAEFGPAEASMQRYPAYEEWRLVTLGKYVEHLDFLSIFQWMSGAFIRTSIFLIFSTKFYSKPKLFLYIYMALLIGAVVYPFGDIALQETFKRVYFPIYFFSLFTCFIILFLMILFSKKSTVVKQT
ncbi:MAG: endospore germination permease [Candidatus Cohnella colombiensis]|uniref:Endospore germination permease n=1 Tax=Candidatus Cohnella colombiensis TaxID=3121368 RepID=A0AA95F6E7_9BACL|nr:MAG: endospore germination permease [Cohnella sp.]